MGETLFFVLGILVSVPVSVFANLATPKWQKFRASRSAGARAKDRERSEAFEYVIGWFAANPADLNTYLLRLTFSSILAVTALVASVLALVAVGSFGPSSSGPRAVFALLATTFSLLCAARLSGLLSRISRVVRAVAERKGWPIHPDGRWPKRMREIRTLPHPPSVGDH